MRKADGLTITMAELDALTGSSTGKTSIVTIDIEPNNIANDGDMYSTDDEH